MICRTPEEAFQAGLDAPCEHGIPNPNECSRCELTDAEIAYLVTLLRPYLRLSAPAVEPSAA